MNTRIGIIGFGHLGKALGEGILRKYPAAVISAYSRKRIDAKGITAAASLRDCVAAADVLVVAVKPKDLDVLLTELSAIKEISGKIVVSVVAGARAAKIAAALGQETIVVKAMPNVCAAIGRSATGIYSYSREAALKTKEIFESIGIADIVESEDQIDAVTALSSSGPAFVAEFLRSWIRSAETAGIPSSIAGPFAFETFAGAIEMLERRGKDVEGFIRSIATPNGTTEAGLRAFENKEGLEVFKAVFNACSARSRELGK
jgi:pyrroline-5-carboxylate reductase